MEIQLYVAGGSRHKGSSGHLLPRDGSLSCLLFAACQSRCLLRVLALDLRRRRLAPLHRGVHRVWQHHDRDLSLLSQWHAIIRIMIDAATIWRIGIFFMLLDGHLVDLNTKAY
jgi:hypothetical protein